MPTMPAKWMDYDNDDDDDDFTGWRMNSVWVKSNVCRCGVM